MSEETNLGRMGFHHIAMKVHDFDVSYRFYVEGLGFGVKRSWQSKDAAAALVDAGNGNYLEIFGGGDRREKQESTITHLAIRVESCDGATEKARSAGARITIEPKDVEIPSEPPVRARIAFCEGPDGESIEFFQNDST